MPRTPLALLAVLALVLATACSHRPTPASYGITVVRR